MIYWHGLGAAFFAEQAAKVAHRRYGTLTGFGMFVQAPRNGIQSQHQSGAVPQQSFGEFVEFTCSAFEKEDELRVGVNPTLRIQSSAWQTGSGTEVTRMPQDLGMLRRDSW